MLIVESQSLDVYRNLAIEEYLMEYAVELGPVLFLWQSASAVVVGKNQNPWRECRLDLMRTEGVSLARRISGGGTVYHDAGNLNYCIIVDRKEYREPQAFDIIRSALEHFDIHAEKTGKSNLSVDGLKFSGNAFCFRRGRAMHHGTLLLDTDLERLNRYLGSVINGIDTHAIASVPAQVMNLAIDREALIRSIQQHFISSYATGRAVASWSDADLDAALLEPLIARQQSVNWQYGTTPRFTVERDGLRYEIVKGVVVDVSGSDAVVDDIDKDFSEIAISWVC